MDEQQLQLQIVQLVQAAMQGDQQATQQIQQIMQAAQQGNQQAVLVALMIQQVTQQMQLQQVQAARFGAKLNYIKQLRGQCPEGYKMEYFKEGGQLCKRCMKVHQDGGEVNKAANTVAGLFKMEAAKCGKKMKKKEAGGVVETEKCGGKPKLKKKTYGGFMRKGSIEKNEGGTSKGGVTLKSEKNSKNKYGDTVTTRRWSDGTTSKRYTPEEGEIIYEGRRGERGVAQLDSLYRADWSNKTAPQLKPRKRK